MRFILVMLFTSFSFILFSQNRQKAFEVNQKLGRGINYGNMFEAPSETGWGNPWQPEYAEMIAELGFNHVRIPIRWEPDDRSSETAPYTVNSTFLSRIKEVVDSTLNNGLYAIINMHHHEALYDNPDQQKARFLAQWKQISEYFADYPDQLLFEILNEPHGNLSAEKWNTFLAEALATIREDNPERIAVIGLAEYGGLAGLSKLQLPDDENIILTVHYYNPFQFTHQGAEWADNSDEWLGTKWNNTTTEREIINNDFAPLKAFEEQKNVPIHIGEFGAYYKADMHSRKLWTNYMARYIESLGWSWAYWEFSAGFGIYDKNSGTYNQELVDALLHNPMSGAATYVGTPVYTSNFPQTIGDWNLQTNGSAVASNVQSANHLQVSISQKGSEAWHIQLTKNNIQLESGKKYRLKFKVKAESDRSMTAYVGKNSSPWTAYSGYNTVNVTDTFAVISYIFDMTSTDNAARITFDLGSSDSDVIFEYIILESVVLQQVTSSKTIHQIKSKIYPNPAASFIVVDNLDDFKDFYLLNMQGKQILNKNLIPHQNKINLSYLSSGTYFVKLTNKENRFTTKIIKK